MGILPTAKKRANCGFTLVELVVVIALLGILVVLSTSITLVLSKNQADSDLEVTEQEEILLFDTAYRNWIKHFDSSEFSISVEDSAIIATQNTVVGEEPISYSFSFSVPTLQFTLPPLPEETSSTSTSEFSSFEGITFSIIQSDGDQAKIIDCTIKLLNSKQTHQILIYLRAATLLAPTAP